MNEVKNELKISCGSSLMSDKRVFAIFFLIFFVIFLLIGFVEKEFNFIFLIAAFTSLIIGFIQRKKITFISISSEGILLPNSNEFLYKKVVEEKKGLLITWKEISSIAIQRIYFNPSTSITTPDKNLPIDPGSYLCINFLDTKNSKINIIRSGNIFGDMIMKKNDLDDYMSEEKLDLYIFLYYVETPGFLTEISKIYKKNIEILPPLVKTSNKEVYNEIKRLDENYKTLFISFDEKKKEWKGAE